MQSPTITTEIPVPNSRAKNTTNERSTDGSSQDDVRESLRQQLLEMIVHNEHRRQFERRLNR